MEFFHNKLGHPHFGPGFVHGCIVVLKQEKAFPKLVTKCKEHYCLMIIGARLLKFYHQSKKKV